MWWVTRRESTRTSTIAAIAERHHDVLTRAHLRAAGVTTKQVDRHVAAGRWRLLTSDVVVLHNGPLPPRARLHAIAAAAPPGAAFGSWTALALQGLVGWPRDDVHLVVARGQRPVVLAGVVVHESRRHDADDVLDRSGLPVHPVERAAVDAASWDRSTRTGAGLLAAVVQQRLTTPDVLLEQLERSGRIKRRRALTLALLDILGGSESLAEIDFIRLCRRAGLPEPTRQCRRQDDRGRWRFLDVEWHLADGRRLVVEVDGIGHIEPRRWYDDLMRTAELPDGVGTGLVRVPATAVRCDPDRVLAILRRRLA